MANNLNFNDQQNVKAALLEYEKDVKINGKFKIGTKKDEYIGNVAHIYDNVNDNEEQVFVLTNNGQGAQQNAVPYTASDEARAQIHDVTVLMKGSETEISTQKLLHDTYTDWVKTDLPAASNILNPGGASEYATEYAKNYARDKAKDGFNNAVEAFEDAIIPTSINLPPEATPLGRFMKKALDNPVSNFIQEKASDAVGFFAERTAEEQVKFPALIGAAFLKKYNDENGNFPPSQFKDAAAHLKEVIRKYPNAKIDLYGHSLGSMNIQYALACLTEEEASHIGTVHLYNGPNAYSILTPEQKARIDSLKYKIYNHIDHKDLVSLGYQDSGSKESSGIVKHLKTKNLKNTGLQHMMHGYIYDKDGNLVLEKGTEAITRKEIIEERMKVYYRLKDKMQKTGGGLSSSERIYLDALQARLASDELIRVVDEGLEQAQKSKAQLDTDLEALEKVLQTVPKGFILNLAEVEEAYAQAGATRQTVVTEVRERFDNRLAAYQSLSNEFHALNEQVNAGIELLKAKDQKIAGEMNQWEQLAY